MISIRFDQRALFVGKTGSGKTYLAERLSAKLPRLLVFDNLHRVSMALSTPDELQAFADGEEIRVKVDRPEIFEELIQQSFQDGWYTVYIDEMLGLMRKPSTVPESVSMLWTRGRGNHIGAWACTQRPARVPIVLMTETEHIFYFRLKAKQDRDRLDELAGIELPPIPKADEHGFYYLSDHQPDILYVREFSDE